jgi:biopolymer transport protein ExbD
MAQQTTQTEPEINITPMLDVVFIMLIFFIVTASFVKESGLSISRPGINTSGDGKAVMITLDPQQVLINQQVVSIDGIEARLNQMQAEQDGLQVRLVSDGNTPVARLVSVVDQVKAARVSQISVSQY